MADVVKVLSIDGGGIRGVIPATILSEIEKRTHAGRVAAAFAFGDPACDVVACRGVVVAAVEDDSVEGAVELVVAAAAEPVADRLAA